MKINTINKKWIGIISIVVMLMFPLYLSLTHTPAEIETAQSLCPIMLTTGLPCPGCGISKSMMYLYEGNFSASIEHHLLGPLFFLFCWIGLLTLSIEIFTKKRYFQNWRNNTTLAYTLAFSLGIYHLFRLGNYLATNSWNEIVAHSIWG